jgi:hypothetical protein
MKLIKHKFKLITFFLSVFLSQATFAQMNQYSGNGYMISCNFPGVNIMPYGQNDLSIQTCGYVGSLSITIFDNDMYVVNSLNPSTVIKSFTGNTMVDFSYQQYEVRNMNTNMVLFTFSQMMKPMINISKVSLAGSQIKNDTLFLCEKEDAINPYLNLYGNSNSSYPDCQRQLNFSGSTDFQYYVNDKQVNSFSGYTPQKDGDILEMRVKRFYQDMPFYSDMCSMQFCINQQNSDSVVSQKVVLKIRQNEILPKPTFLNNIKSICAGDTATVLKDPSLKQVEIRINRGYDYITAIDTSIAKKYTQVEKLYLRSLTVKANGCYAVSDTVNVLRKNCGFSMVRGVVNESGYNNIKTFANVKVGMQISGSPNIAYTYSNADGIYEFKIDTLFTKPQTIKTFIHDPNYFAADNSPYSTWTYSGTDHFITNYLQTYLLSTNDLAVTLTSGRNRPGFTMPIYVNVENRGKLTNKGDLTLNLDANYIYVDAIPAPKTIVGNTLTWDLDSIKSSNTSYLRVNAKLSPSITLGTNLKSTLVLTPAISDLNSSNNTSVLDAIVTGSFDPNDIEVNPKGYGVEGFIKPTDSLDYVIRCQNMGTDTAFTIVVKAPISPAWDLATLEMIDASHPYKLSIVNDTLYCTFNDINLLWKSYDEPNSHARLHFKVKQKNGNAPSTKIEASAGIYFDYNAPVMTNVVVNTIELPTGVSSDAQSNYLIITPNPSNGEVVIKQSGHLKIYNIIGEQVYVSEHQEGKLIDLNYLTKGIYFVQLTSQNQIFTSKLILK